MATTTPVFGWPILQDSDDINTVAKTVAAGITAIENMLVLADSSKSVADNISSYPIGISMVTVGSTGGWPASGAAAVVVTVRRRSGFSGWQLWGRTGASTLWVRSGDTTNGWANWSVATGPGTPTAQASGQITLTPNGAVASAVVMFPSSLFTGAPRVLTSSNSSTRPDIAQNSSTNNVTATQMTVYAYRSDSLAMSVAWMATQGLE